MVQAFVYIDVHAQDGVLKILLIARNHRPDDLITLRWLTE